MTERKPRQKRAPGSEVDNSTASKQSRLFTLKVSLVGGPMSDEFCEDNPVISRTMQVRGDQTLEELHWALFKAFDRFDEHMFEFQIGKKPNDRNALKYVMPETMDGPSAGIVDETTLDSMGLKKRDKFFYWFDFGDDWWHKIVVESIEDEAPQGKYPKVIERVGKSPPQYCEDDY